MNQQVQQVQQVQPVQQVQQAQQVQQQLKQLQHLQQQQYFVPISGERVVSGVVMRNNKTPLKSTTTPTTTTPTTTTPATTTPAPTTTVSSSDSEPLVRMVQDVVLGMILHIPAMRTKLQSILDNPSLMTGEIKKAHDELKAELPPNELRQLDAYACQDSSRLTMGNVMQNAFSNIMADGKIDMNDAPHFLTLIHECITLFSTDAVAANAVSLNSNTVINFLHFVIKCILILTLDGPEEDSALVMLDCSFKLVKLTVMPLIAGKKWCCFK